jgi:hypothetical protein
MAERPKKRAQSRRIERPDGGKAFVPDPQDGPARVQDDLAELLAEDFLNAATSGEEHSEETREEELTEEFGGPFVPSASAEEFADGTDESNTADASREPFPTTSSAPSVSSR